MSARANILARIRRQQGRSGETPEADRDAVRAVIAARTRGPQPATEWDLPARFMSECAKLSSTCDTVDHRAEIPAAVARYLTATALAPTLVGWQGEADLPWAAAGIDFSARPATGSDKTGITGCFAAIAETGTVMLLGSQATPKATALLPETHICIVEKRRIVRTMEDAFALMRAEVGEPPRALFLVSGPSRTADIEQTIVIGAHGPYRVHVILV